MDLISLQPNFFDNKLNVALQFIDFEYMSQVMYTF